MSYVSHDKEVNSTEREQKGQKKFVGQMIEKINGKVRGSK